MYLVTGASGFTGGHLVRYLLRRGIPVRAMVRRKDAGDALKKLGAHIVVADLSDERSVRDAVNGVTGVFHIAALFREAKLGEREYFQVNLEGTRTLLDAAVVSGVQRFVHCSTVGVLGNVANPPATEDTPYNPGDYYQRSKVAGEKLALEYFRSGKIQGSVIRPGMIWGPGDTRVLKLFRMIAQRRFMYVGSGNSLVHFVDVRDLARAFLLAMENPSADGEIITIAGKESVPLREVVQAISEECGVNAPKIHLPVKPIQIAGSICEHLCRPIGIEPPLHRRRVDFFTKNRCFDISKAKRLLGYKPEQDLHEEIRDMVAWYRSMGWVRGGSSGLIDRLLPVRSAYMVRDLNGTILDWSDSASAHYGFNLADAKGAVSHELLRTEFPDDVSSINHRLRLNRSWEGPLRHTRKDGTRVQVRSRWVLVPDEERESHVVVETNRFVGNAPSSGSLAPFVIGMQEVFSDSCTGLLYVA